MTTEQGKAGRWRKFPDPSDFTGNVLNIAYKEAVRAVERDAEVLEQMRSRANILLAALAIGGAVLGGILSNSDHWPPPLTVVVPLGLAIVSCIFILWPTRDHGNLTVAARDEKKQLKFVGRLLKPWVELLRALGQNQRLWKTRLNEDDLDAARKEAQGDSEVTIKQVLLARLYAGHVRNDGTLSRRADLLRLATLFLLAFVIALSVWLTSSTSTTKGGGHPSSTSTTPTPLPTPVPTVPSPSTEPGRG